MLLDGKRMDDKRRRRTAGAAVLDEEDRWSSDAECRRLDSMIDCVDPFCLFALCLNNQNTGRLGMGSVASPARYHNQSHTLRSPRTLRL